MESLFKVLSNKCTLCFACIRNCPVKAIDINSKSEKAEISDSRCIGCGICYQICPEKAITYRKDTKKAISILDSTNTKIALCDPAIASEFEDISDYRKFVGMLKLIGFSKVYETSFAIDLMARDYSKLYDESKGRLYISSYCSSVIEYIEKYSPELIPNIAPIGSPMLYSTALVKKTQTDINTKIAYISPCISAKNEVKKYSAQQIPDVVLTFEELRELFNHYNISESYAEADDFDAPVGAKGLLYPIGTGILDALNLDDSALNSKIISIEGQRDVHDVFATFVHDYTDINKHINAFYCEGCIMGPGTTSKTNKYQRCSAVIKYSKKRLGEIHESNWINEMALHTDIHPEPIFSTNDQRRAEASEEVLDEIIASLHDNPHKDDGCGACGFKNCKEFAQGIHLGNAHPDMCLRRSINSQKAYTKFLKQTDERVKMFRDEIGSLKTELEKNENNLNQTIETITKTINNLTAGVLFVTSDLKIHEANQSLISIIGEEAEMINDVIPGMKGADIRSLLPPAVSSVFEYAITNNEPIHNKDIIINDKKYILNVFNIFENKLAGAIFRSFHSDDVRYEEFEKRIIEVIDQNLTMVQNIGFLLGEGASNTERMLNSVIESFKKEQKK